MKTLLQILPMMPVGSSEERRQLRPLGRHVQRYTQTVEGLPEIVRAADELGYWGMAFVEHHFHSEGFEVAPTPGIMNAWLGSYARRMRMGQLGYVMSTHNPLRVAEETAVLDHILKGRFFVGFARGYQSRWVRTLGQQYKALATLSNRESAQQALADDRNQRIFRELVTLVVKAWTEPSFSYKGEFFQVPFPYEGIDDYPAYPAAQQYGAPREIDAQNRVREICVVPAPYQKPHPPVFISSSGSEESARWAGEQGFNCIYFAPLVAALKQEAVYREAAAQAGRKVSLGQQQGVVRFIHLGKTREAAYEKVARCVAPPFTEFFRYFFPGVLAGSGSAVDQMVASGLVLAGTVDDVKRQMEEMYKVAPFEYPFLISYFALQSKESFLEDMELFATKVMPAFV